MTDNQIERAHVQHVDDDTWTVWLRNRRLITLPSKGGADDLAEKINAHVDQIIASLAPADPEGWVITTASGTRYRAWGGEGTYWTDDLSDACFYARRCDAERAHAEDEDAWGVVKLPIPDAHPLPTEGEGTR